MSFSTGNASFDRLLRSARANKLRQSDSGGLTIDVKTSEEKQANEDNVKTQSQLMDELSKLGVEVASVSSLSSIDNPLGQAISESVAESQLGIPTSGMTVGERGQEIATKQQTFPDELSRAFSNVGGRESVTSGLGLATYGAMTAGQTELAKGLFQGTQMLSGMGGMALNVIGPTQKDPLGYNMAMGSGAFRATSNKVMGIHYDTADKITQGIAGYKQGRIGNETISMTPGLFGIGSVLTGNVPPGLTAGMFSDIIDEANAYAKSVEPFGGVGSTSIGGQGISADSFSSPTEAAQNMSGYSSYDAMGNPTGAAPSGSQYSSTGTFSTDDNNSSDNYSGYSDSDFSGFNDGGRIGMNMGDRPGETMGGMPPQQPPTQPQQTEVVADMGFVDFDPNAPEAETVNDKYPKNARKDDFVINAPAVEFAGKQDITKMIVDAVESLRQKGIEVVVGDPKIPLEEQAQIIVAQNEAMIPKIVAEEIGYDRLRKINNRGKKEVQRRKEEAEATEGSQPQAQMVSKGGFIGMAEGDTPYYTRAERDKAARNEYGGDPVDYFDQQKGVYRVEEELDKSTPEKFSQPFSVREQLQSNPITPFNKGETETYNAPPLPPEGMTPEYKSGVEFGDTEQGFQYLNQTGDNEGRQGQGFNDLLLAGLRDRRSLSDFLKVSDYYGVGRTQRAAGVYFPYYNKIAIADRSYQAPYMGNPGLAGDTEVHELMHKGATLLREDPNFDWNVYTFGNKMYGKPDKLGAAKAEHRYIQAVVNTAFIDREIEDKTRYAQDDVRRANRYLDYVLADIEEDRKSGLTPYMSETDVIEAKNRLKEKKNDLDVAKKTVMLTELSRVYNYYFDDSDKDVFNKVVKAGNPKFSNFEGGILDFAEVSTPKKGVKKFFSSEKENINFNSDNLQDNFSLEEVKEIFKLSNIVMMNNNETLEFLNTVKDVAPKSTRDLNKMYISPGQESQIGTRVDKKAKGGFISMAGGGSVREEGGFMAMQEGGNIGEEYGVNILEPMNPKTKEMIQSLISKGNITRGSVEEVIDVLPDRDALAMMIFAESYASEDSPDAMRGIGETALNRLKDKTYSFKNQNTLKDVLKARSNKGSGSKMFSYEGLEPKYLKPRLSEMLNNKYWQRALDAADNALETEPDMEQYKLRDDVFTYARVGEASNRLKSNKRNEYFTTIGDHDFYSRTPEKGGRISSETMGQPSSFYR